MEDKAEQFPIEIMFRIILNDDLEIKDILALSLVSTRWNNVARNNEVWIKAFIKDFSYNPVSYIKDPIIGPYTFFDTYKHQLELRRRIQKKCGIKHSSMEEPGLAEAIQEENIPLIHALLASEHKIILQRFFTNANAEEEAHPADENDYLKAKFKPLFLKLSNLPKSLLIPLMKRSFGNQQQEITDSWDMTGLALFTCFAEPILLKKVFKTINEAIFDLIEWLDVDDCSFISLLFSEPERLILVLNILQETIGNANLSKLLVIRAQDDPIRAPFCEILDAYTNREYREHVLPLLLTYLLPQDFKVFLLSPCFTKNEKPFLFDIAQNGDVNLLSTILDGWKDKKEEAFEHKDSNGRNILVYALCSSSISIISIIRNHINTAGFYDLLTNIDSQGLCIVAQVLNFSPIDQYQNVRYTLDLLQQYQLLCIAQDFYEYSDTSSFPDNLIDLFAEYKIVKNTSSSRCVIL